LLSLFSMLLRPPLFTPFPYTTLFRSTFAKRSACFKAVLVAFEEPSNLSSLGGVAVLLSTGEWAADTRRCCGASSKILFTVATMRSEEHTSELQSRFDLVCRLLLEKKK